MRNPHDAATLKHADANVNRVNACDREDKFESLKEEFSGTPPPSAPIRPPVRRRLRSCATFGHMCTT